MTGQSVKQTVAGMVTLYNSERSVLQRISTYISQVQKLYAVDNSEQSDPELIEALVKRYPTVEYISNQGNKGIAYALNVAAEAAIRDQFTHLLMMDDDSETPADLVDTLYYIARYDSISTVGIVSAQSDPTTQREDEQDVITTITSGSLLNLRAYQKVGPFMNDLFIDWVDHEYCFRLARNGYMIVVVNRIKFGHRLGIFKEKKLFGFIPMRWRSHGPIRLYYKFRNSLFVISKYWKQLPLSFTIPVYFELLRDIAKIAFVEENKPLYISAIRRGVVDACQKRLGKFVDR